MKLYDNRNNTYQVTCGYCRHEGHNKRYCPTLRKHWEANKNFDGHLSTTPKDIHGSDFGGWRKLSDQDAQTAFRWHFDYIDKIMTSDPTTPKKRKASNCGFCGSKAHTRRTCSEMREFVKILEETNKAYRKAFYETVFVEHGLGIGAFVEYRTYHYSQGDVTNTSLIMDIDFDSIDIGNTMNRWNSYNTNLRITYMHNDREYNFSTSLFSDPHFPLLDRTGMRHLASHHDGISKVIVPAPSLPDKEWFLGQSPAFDWVVKKKDFKTLFDTYGRAIMLYHPQGDLLWEKLKKKL